MSQIEDNHEETDDVPVDKPSTKSHKAKKELYDEIIEFYKQNSKDNGSTKKIQPNPQDSKKTLRNQVFINEEIFREFLN